MYCAKLLLSIISCSSHLHNALASGSLDRSVAHDRFDIVYAMNSNIDASSSIAVSLVLSLSSVCFFARLWKNKGRGKSLFRQYLPPRSTMPIHMSKPRPHLLRSISRLSLSFSSSLLAICFLALLERKRERKRKNGERKTGIKKQRSKVRLPLLCQGLPPHHIPSLHSHI